jgi:hypothetical protein
VRPAYTVSGGPLPPEGELGLRGYPDGVDVCDNRAGDPFELGSFRESLLCLASADEQDRLDADGWRAVELAANAIADRREEPDAGIGEPENTGLDPQSPDLRRRCASRRLSSGCRPPTRRRAVARRRSAGNRTLIPHERTLHEPYRW